ncbi:MAG: NAD(P)-binding domain-containing protein [Bacteroidetes bacterium]|nr:NAD(P)-binding domain-containing protein [Bacteroidota bacterium]
MDDTFIILLIAFFLFLILVIPFLQRRKKKEKYIKEADLNSLKYGLKEPVSLHPVVDLDRCIGSGGCIEACPEKDVLGIHTGQAITVSPARCIGHGLCERSCPVNAITLVFGSEKRGVDIPRIRENFETNISGIFIIGELGGMGLIKNAFEQGKQCIELMRKELTPSTDSNIYDVIIVGCGPAGLSAAITAKHHGLNNLVLERESIGGTVRYYPRKKVVMTRPVEIPGYGKFKKRELLKEELIELWEELVQHFSLFIKTGINVSKVSKNGTGLFKIETENEIFEAKKVILAIGRRGTPRKLGIYGEDLPNVSYSLREPDHFENMIVSVIGGGDSAIEAAIALADQTGNTVRLIYRSSKFSRLKPQNLETITTYQNEQKIEILLKSQVTENSLTHIKILSSETNTEQELPNDYLFIFAGGILPTAFLNEIGIEIDTKFGNK